jgi:hypothetical protein
MTLSPCVTKLFASLLIAVCPVTALAQATTPAVPAAPVMDLTVELARQKQALANARDEIAQLNADLALRDELLTLGLERNAQLFVISEEILDKYRNAGILTALNRREPFIQASRVRMERLVQDYEDRLRSARITAQTLAPSVEKRMSRELGAPPQARDPEPAADKPR